MKNKRNIIFLLIIATFLVCTLPVYAEEVAPPIIITGQTDYGPYEEDHDTSSNGGYLPRSALYAAKTIQVGFLVQLIKYDNSSSTPTENVLAKKMLLYGSLGVEQSDIKTVDLGDLEEKHDKYFKTQLNGGGSDSCGHTEDYYRSVIENDFKITWGAASISEGSSLYNTGQKAVSVPAAGVGAIQASGGLNEQFFSTLPKIKDLLGVDVDVKHIEQYYVKYEPIYRYYPAILSETEGFTFPDKSEFFNSNYAPDYTFSCGHTKRVYEKTDSTPHSEDPDEDGNCANGTLDESSGKCKWTTYTYGWVTHDCYVTALYTYQYNVVGPIGTHAGTARESFKGKIREYYSLASNNSHDAVDDNGVKIPGTDYYIGSTHLSAMAMSDGTHNFNSKNNLYKLISDPSDAVNCTTSSCYEHKTVGMALYALSTLLKTEYKCPEVCSGYANKGSDEYLQCSQSYCDSHIEYSSNAYATDTKKECILNECGYVPKKPMDCNNTSSPYYSDALSIPSGASDGKNINGSYCGYVDGAAYNAQSTKTGNSASKAGAYKDCKRIGDTSFDEEHHVYAYGVSNTQNTYINVACREITTADFKDISRTILKKGEAFDYDAYIHGRRDCIVFFDTNQWVFDFASTHSVDTVRKMLLLNKLKAYNELTKAKNLGVRLNAVNVDTAFLNSKTIYEKAGEGITDGVYKVSDTIAHSEGTVAAGNIESISSLAYSTDPSKMEVKSQVTEYVNKSPYYGGNSSYNQSNTGDNFKLERVATSTSDISAYEGKVLTVIATDEVRLYSDYLESERRQIVSDASNNHDYGVRYANRYQYYGNADFEYALPQVCVSDDNKRTVKYSPSKTCSDAFGSKAAQRLYYTHLNATISSKLSSGQSHNIVTSISVKKTTFQGTQGSEYLTGPDTCPYKIEDTAPPISCSIKFDRSSSDSEASIFGQVCYKPDNVYITSGTKATVYIDIDNKSSNDTTINSYYMVATTDNGAGPWTSSVGVDSFDIPVNKMKFTTQNNEQVSNSKVTVTGYVTYTDKLGAQSTVKCKGHMTIAKDTSGGCTITKDTANKRYVINPTGSIGDGVYVSTGNTQNILENMRFSKVEPIDGVYFIPMLKSDTDPAEIIVAKMGSSTDAPYCSIEVGTCGPRESSCYEECGPNYEEDCVTSYCNTKGLTDGVDYVPDCKTACSSPSGKHPCTYYIPQSKREDYNYVEGWCKNSSNLNRTTHKVAEECIEMCYEEDPPDSDSFIYRPINLNNPFPKSTFSAGESYSGGNRAVSKLWRINYNTIVEDRDDITNGRKVEYLIELGPSDILEIRNNTYTYNSSHSEGSIYSDTTNKLNGQSDTRTCYLPNGDGRTYKGYCSDFIHGTNYGRIFKIVDGLAANNGDDEV